VHDLWHRRGALAAAANGDHEQHEDGEKAGDDVQRWLQGGKLRDGLIASAENNLVCPGSDDGEHAIDCNDAILHTCVSLLLLLKLGSRLSSGRFNLPLRLQLRSIYFALPSYFCILQLLLQLLELSRCRRSCLFGSGRGCFSRGLLSFKVYLVGFGLLRLLARRVA
jgi:hypothetical protein